MGSQTQNGSSILLVRRLPCMVGNFKKVFATIVSVMHGWFVKFFDACSLKSPF